MRTRDAERRAFLRSLKPRMIEIQALVAQDAGRMVSQAELDADIASAKAEYHDRNPRRKRPHLVLEG